MYLFEWGHSRENLGLHTHPLPKSGKEGSKTNCGNNKKISPDQSSEHAWHKIHKFRFWPYSPETHSMDVLPHSQQGGRRCLSSTSSPPPDARFSPALKIQCKRTRQRKYTACCMAILYLAEQLWFPPWWPSPIKEQISLAGRISTSQVLEGNPRHKGSQKLSYLPSYTFPHLRLFTWAPFICMPLLPSSAFSNKQTPNQ